MAGLTKDMKAFIDRQTNLKSAISDVQDKIYCLEDELKYPATSDDRIDQITYDLLPKLDEKRAELGAELDGYRIHKGYRWLNGLTLVGGSLLAAAVIGLGVAALKGKEYKLTDPDKLSIARISATYVTPVPGPQGSSGAQGLNGEQGIQGLVGPQGVPGQKPTVKDIETAVNEYFKANPPSVATPVPTKAPATTPAAPTVAPTPAPYELPSRFEVSYSAAQAMFSRDPAGFSKASGVEQATWRIILNGKDSNESELTKIGVTDGKYTLYFTNSGKPYTADRSGSAKTLETYLKTQTTPEERKLITPLKQSLKVWRTK